MSELKPCPFCGGEADKSGWLNGDGDYGPECMGCGATAINDEYWNTRAPQSEWISVDDRLPESDDEVLVVAHGETRACMFNPWLSDPSKNREHSYRWFEELDIPNYGSERCNIVGVTHWMPLPEPPK